MGLDNPIHIAFLLILLLLVFGAKRLPEMGRSLGDGMRGFKDAISGEGTPAAQPMAQPALVAQPPTQRRRPPRSRRRSGRAAPEQPSAPRPRAQPQARRASRSWQRAVGSIGHEDRLSVVDHLEELRARLIVCLAVVAVAFGFCFWQNHALLNIINAPLAHQTQKQVKAGNGPLGSTYTVQQSARTVATQLKVVVQALERRAAARRRRRGRRWRM